MDLTSIGAFVTGVGGFALGVWAIVDRRRDQKRAAVERAAKQHHDDKSVAVEEIEVAIRWQNEIIKDMRDANKQLRDDHTHCQEEIAELRDEQAVDRRIIAELRDEIRVLRGQVERLERGKS